MRWTKVCPLLGAALLACASEESEYLGPGSMNEGGSASGGAEPTSGTAAGGSASGGSGSAGSASGGRNAGGSGDRGGASGAGGTFNDAGNSSGGTFSSGGTSGGGAGGAAGSAGAGGNGGAAGNGSSGKGGGGAGGMAGAGGTPPTQCTGVVIPPKTSWQGTALRSSAADPPNKVFDGLDTTRFASGSPQMGDEWLQIDFGEVVTLNEVRLHTNNDDYFRHYQLRLSNTSQDFASAILKEADGATGTLTVPITPAKAGRYLTIRQTGVVTPTWWSLHEVSIACN